MDITTVFIVILFLCLLAGILSGVPVMLVLLERSRTAERMLLVMARFLGIYRAVIPFVVLQLLALCLVALFPQLATWLPAQLM